MQIGRPLEILEVELTPEEAPKPYLSSDPEAPGAAGTMKILLPEGGRGASPLPGSRA
jgi:hypothetical protein